MPKFLYDLRGSVCNIYQSKMYCDGGFYSGTQLWVIDKETNLKRPCKCGELGCTFIEVRFKRGASPYGIS